MTDKATLNPSSDLLPNTTYQVTLTDDIRSTTDKTLSNAQTWSFKTISSPEVLTKSPAAAADGVPVDQTIRVTFDKNMDWSTVNSTSFYLQKSGGGSVSATMAKSIDKRTVILTPVADLQEATTYVATLTVAIEAENGLSLPAPVTWTFTTGATAPEVTVRVPANDATGVPLGQVVSATFDQDMAESTITSATFYIKKSGGSPLPATVSYSGDTLTATLDPLTDLEGGLNYEVTLTTAVEGENGAPLASAEVWSFTTIAGAPVLTTKVPAGGATNVPVGQVVSATFDQDMDASTITGANFYVQKAGGSPLPATVAYSAATRTATIDPSADLEAGST